MYAYMLMTFIFVITDVIHGQHMTEKSRAHIHNGMHSWGTQTHLYAP